MMDDFVKGAFADAEKASIDKETNAFIEHVANNDAVQMAPCLKVGILKMDKLCEVAIKGGVADILAEYAQACILTAFHIGYRAALEEKE